MCEQCGMADWRVTDTRMTVRGVRRTRFECNVCKFRWTEFAEGVYKIQRQRTDAWRRISRDDARAIIESELPQRILAEQYGITRQAISLIQTGRTYKDVYEEYHKARHGKMMYCRDCSNWKNEQCGFEFPEAGDWFATECVLYDGPGAVNVLH